MLWYNVKGLSTFYTNKPNNVKLPLPIYYLLIYYVCELKCRSNNKNIKYYV